MVKHATMMDSFGAGYAAAIADVNTALSNLRYVRGTSIIGGDEKAANDFFSREIEHLQTQRFTAMHAMQKHDASHRGGA